MEKVVDLNGKHIGYSWVCSWCHDCGSIKPSEEETITDYLEHQGTEACKIAEARYDYYMNDAL